MNCQHKIVVHATNEATLVPLTNEQRIRHWAFKRRCYERAELMRKAAQALPSVSDAMRNLGCAFEQARRTSVRVLRLLPKSE